MRMHGIGASGSVVRHGRAQLAAAPAQAVDAVVLDFADAVDSGGTFVSVANTGDRAADWPTFAAQGSSTVGGGAIIFAGGYDDGGVAGAGFKEADDPATNPNVVSVLPVGTYPDGVQKKTNTGLSTITGGTHSGKLLMGGHGRELSGSTPVQPNITVWDPATNTYSAEFAVGGGATTVQGVAYDSSRDLFLACTGGSIVRCDQAGAFTTSFTISGTLTANGIVYLPGVDMILALASSGTDGKLFDAGTGAYVGDLDLADMDRKAVTPGFDDLGYYPEGGGKGILYGTTGANNAAGKVRYVGIDLSGATPALDRARGYGEWLVTDDAEVDSPEGAAYDGTYFYFNSDGYYHGTTTGDNRVVRHTVPVPPAPIATTTLAVGLRFDCGGSVDAAFITSEDEVQTATGFAILRSYLNRLVFRFQCNSTGEVAYGELTGFDIRTATWAVIEFDMAAKTVSGYCDLGAFGVDYGTIYLGSDPASATGDFEQITPGRLIVGSASVGRQTRVNDDVYKVYIGESAAAAEAHVSVA